jgi:hypothetical protein
MLAGYGVTLDRSTLVHWVDRAAWWLQGVYDQLLTHIHAAGRVYCDETPLPVLEKGRRRTRKCQFWAHGSDDRPWNGPAPPAVAYVFAPGRNTGAIFDQIGTRFTGVLQVDGYAAYKALVKRTAPGRIRLAFCLAHYPEPNFMWSIWILAHLAEALSTGVAQDNTWGRGSFRRRLGDGSADPVSNDVGCRDLRPPEGVARCAPSTLPPSSRRRLLIAPPWHLRTDKPSRHPCGALVLPRGAPHLQSAPGFSLRQAAGAAQLG